MKKKKGLKACSSKSIDRDALEAYVLKQLSMKIFDDGAANEIAQYYSEYCGKADKEYRENQNHQLNWWYAQALEGHITGGCLKAH